MNATQVGIDTGLHMAGEQATRPHSASHDSSCDQKHAAAQESYSADGLVLQTLSHTLAICRYADGTGWTGQQFLLPVSCSDGLLDILHNPLTSSGCTWIGKPSGMA